VRVEDNFLHVYFGPAHTQALDAAKISLVHGVKPKRKSAYYLLRGVTQVSQLPQLPRTDAYRLVGVAKALLEKAFLSALPAS
jgi:hypothetical protein